MKTKTKYRKKHKQALKGSISVFLAFVLLPLLTVAGLVVDCARIEAAGDCMDAAGELTLNSVLSEYDRMLYGIYGLFALSSSDEELTENVTRYFRNTITNIGLLENSDSYTRSFLNSFFGALSSGTVPEENLVRLIPEYLYIETVPASSIVNPAVMEKQIVDYMKYRGPVSLAGGLLTKLSGLRDLAAQTKAAEKKIDYETTLSRCEKAAAEAYDAIRRYKELSARTGLPGGGEGITEALKQAEAMMSASVEMTAAASKLFDPGEYVGADGINGIDEARARISALAESIASTDFDAEAAALSEAQRLKPSGFADVISFDPGASASIRETDISFMTDSGPLLASLNYSSLCREYIELGKKFGWGTESDGVAAEKRAFYESVLKKAEAYLTDYSRLLSQNTETAKKLKTGALGYHKAAMTVIRNDVIAVLSEEKEQLRSAVVQLERLGELLDPLEREKEEWKVAIDALEQGEIKTGMKSDYTLSAEGFDRDKAERLRAALNKDAEKLEKLIDRALSVSLAGLPLSPDSDGKKSESIFNELSSLISERFLKTGQSCGDFSGELMRETFTGAPGGFSPLFKGFTDLDGNGSGTAFYRILQKRFGRGTDSVTAEQKDASELRSLLVSYAGSETPKTSDAPTAGKISEIIDKKIADEIERLVGETVPPREMPEITFDGDDDAALSEGAADGLGGVSGLLGGLKDIGNASLEVLFAGEYLTEMFSCATDPVYLKNGAEVLSLSGADMSKNGCFGGEIEYIICGLDSVQANVAAAEAMVFGVRFALNLLYVFTDSDSRAQTLAVAEAIAGWTGFGAPVVQNVISAAWALAETGVDIALLKDGKSVALYKSRTTWHLGFSGLKKTLVAGAASAAIRVTGDIFDAVSAYAADKSAEGADRLIGRINDYADEMLDAVCGEVCDIIAVPIGDMASVIAEAGEAVGIDEICGRLDKIFADADASSGGLTGKCVSAAVKKLEGDKNGIVKEICDAVKSAADSEAAEAYINVRLFGSDGKSGIIGKIRDKIKGAVSKEIEEYGDAFKKETASMIKKGGDNLKTAVGNRIAEFAAGISGGELSTAPGSLTVASGFGMTYKEYLKMFVLLSYPAGGEAMLGRAAGLIQINISAAKSGDESSFDITKCRTMAVCRAAADMKTFFMSVPVLTSGAGGRVAEFDFSGIGKGRQRIVYNGILSY